MSGSFAVRAESFLVEERKSLSQWLWNLTHQYIRGPSVLLFPDRGPDHFGGATGIGAMRFLTMEWSS